MSFSTASTPERVRLVGSYVALEPLDAEHHAGSLAAADRAGEPGTWDWLPYGPWRDEAEHRDWLAEQQAGTDPLFFAAVVDGRALGVATLMSIVPEHGRIEIGHVWLSQELQRTRAATEAFHLLMDYAFELGNRRLEWKTDARNDASRAAALRLGLGFEGVFAQHMWVKQRNRDTAWYALLDRDWPRVDRALRAWLAPENFDAAGIQLEPLRAGRQTD